MITGDEKLNGMLTVSKPELAVTEGNERITTSVEYPAGEQKGGGTKEIVVHILRYLSIGFLDLLRGTRNLLQDGNREKGGGSGVLTNLYAERNLASTNGVPDC